MTLDREGSRQCHDPLERETLLSRKVVLGWLRDSQIYNAFVVAQWLERKTLILEVVGSRPSVRRPCSPNLGVGWQCHRHGPGKSIPNKVGLAPGEVPQSRLFLGVPPGVSAGEMLSHKGWLIDEVKHCELLNLNPIVLYVNLLTRYGRVMNCSHILEFIPPLQKHLSLRGALNLVWHFSDYRGGSSQPIPPEVDQCCVSLAKLSHTLFSESLCLRAVLQLVDPRYLAAV